MEDLVGSHLYTSALDVCSTFNAVLRICRFLFKQSVSIQVGTELVVSFPFNKRHYASIVVFLGEIVEEGLCTPAVGCISAVGVVASSSRICSSIISPGPPITGPNASTSSISSSSSSRPPMWSSSSSWIVISPERRPNPEALPLRE